MLTHTTVFGHCSRNRLDSAGKELYKPSAKTTITKNFDRWNKTLIEKQHIYQITPLRETIRKEMNYKSQEFLAYSHFWKMLVAK